MFPSNRNVLGCFRIKADSSWAYTFSHPSCSKTSQFYLYGKSLKVDKLPPFLLISADIWGTIFVLVAFLLI